MNWSVFYLMCFAVGFGLSALSFLFGSFDVHGMHLHFDDGGHAGHAGHAQADGSSSHRAGAPWFNLGTVAAFLAWFGGTGYLLMRYYSVWFGSRWRFRRWAGWAERRSCFCFWPAYC